MTAIDELSRIPPPPGEDEIELHERIYEVRSFRIDPTTFRLRGRVTDTKPAGFYVDDDPDPLQVHDMVVDLVLRFPDLIIAEATVVMDTHPHRSCPSIEGAYEQLVGLSIARGFSRRVTELFGGPNGCTHVGALLRAMAPVAVQSMYSMQRMSPDHAEQTADERKASMAFVLNSCHVWDENGIHAAAARRGEFAEAPVWIEDRLRKLGRLNELNNWRD